MNDEKQINVRVPKDLAKRARIKAIEEGKSMQEVLETLIKEYVTEEEPKPQKQQTAK
jgi:predicted HicB family RNase H-like nuclease